MKLVRQTALEYREGTSDKVYEVDLCEVGPDRFVVNFRYGRRGAKLKDGSKTAIPVGRAEADKVFAALVREKTSKGYKEHDANAPAAPPPAATVRVEDVADPRHRRILEMLTGQGKRGWTQDVDKLVWRAGELRIRGAAKPIAALLAGATDRRSWNVARALLRCGDPEVLPQLYALWESDKVPPHVRSMAAHAIAVLSPDDDRDRFVRRALAALPTEVVTALQETNVPALIALCRTYPELPDRLYLVADDAQRPTLLALLNAVPYALPTFLGVRRVLQVAEARGDGEVWGVLARRVETEKAAVASIQRRRGSAPVGAWSRGTRRWFRRRVWRILHRLGLAGQGDEYAALAAGLLLAFTDADARPVSPAGGPYGAYWALGHVLYQNSPRYTCGARHLNWRYAGRPQPAPTTREEAWPEHWDGRPELLAGLLGRSACGAVHEFAARALRANRPAWAKIAISDLMAWFRSPYAATATFAAEVAVTRYDPKNPDMELVLALLGCAHEGARTTAAGWVTSNPAPFLRDLDFLTRMILSFEAGTRRLALELLGAASLPPDHARIIVENVIGAALRADPSDERSTPRLRDAAAVLMMAFSHELKRVPLDRVAALIAHACAGTAELGAKILLGHETRAPDLPDELLAAAMTSVHPGVRGIGIRLYGELPDAVLAERFRVLVALVTNTMADVRAAARPVVARLAATNPGFGRVLFGALLPVLVADGPDGLHDDLVHLLRNELASLLPGVSAADVFRLLRATQTIVQELGGELLRTNVEPGSLEPGQLAQLTSSDVLTVRRTAWALLEARVDDVRRAPDSVLPLLDASWEDSRDFAFRYVEDKVGAEHLPAAVTIAVCDSVRPEVQAFGRRLVTRMFDAADGPQYLSMLAQHPDPDMQTFASAWLEQHAAGHADRLQQLVPYFIAILARPNRAKVAKARVLAFLANEALRDEPSARVVASVLGDLVLSRARTHRDAAILTLVRIHARYPEIPVPLRVLEPEVRGAV